MRYNYERIGEIIKDLRKSTHREGDGRPFDQEGFTEALNLSMKRQTLGKIERGDADVIDGVSFGTLKRIAAYFGVSVGYLLGEYDSSTKEIADIREVTGLSNKAIEELIFINRAKNVSELLYGEGGDYVDYLDELEKQGRTLSDFGTTSPKKALNILASSLCRWCTFTGIKRKHPENVNNPTALRLKMMDYLLTPQKTGADVYEVYPLLDALCAYVFNLTSEAIPENLFFFGNKQSALQMLDVQEEVSEARLQLSKYAVNNTEREKNYE